MGNAAQLWLILSNTQDSEPSPASDNKAKRLKHFAHAALTAFLAVAVSVGAYDGFHIYDLRAFAANSQSFNTKAATIDEVGGSLATIPLLEKGALEDASGGGDIELTAGALSAPLTRSTERDAVDENQGSVSIYVVQGGDTLDAIAETFDVSINTIVWANDLDSPTINPGDTLIVLPMTGVRHVVEEGDTLESIAEKYRGDIEEIREYNGLDEGDSIAPGDVLDIPDGEIVGAESIFEAAGPFFTHPLPYGIRTQGIHGHNGVDIAARIGTSILAAAPGTVRTAYSGGWNGGYGSYVVVEHSNGTRTLYGHMHDVLVSPGQSVAAGQVIGTVGDTGRSTGPHLHFEVRGGVNPF